MNFIKASLKHKQVTLSILFLVFVLGVNSLVNMPRREDPFVTVPGGLVIAYYPGADAATVESHVTRKLEEYLFRFDEVMKEKTYSVTSDGTVVVHVWMQDNVRKPDIFWNKLRHQMITAKALELPAGVTGPLVNSDFGDTESMIIAISSDDASHAELKEHLLKLSDRLRRVKAVSKIRMIGEQLEQVSVRFVSERLARHDIKLVNVIKILQSRNYIGPTGEISVAGLTTPLYTNGRYKTEEDIRNQVVGASATGALVKLSDIADIKREPAEPTSAITVNGKKALLLAIQMYEGENIVISGRQIDSTIAGFTGLLPGNISLATIVNQPQVIDRNISKFLREFLMSIIAVIIVVMLLLPLRIAAVAATAIPMTIAATFCLMHLLGIELQQVSLATLVVVLGMVVDDAIVIADNYVELLDKGYNRWTAAWRSATDLVVPVLTATITIIGAFLPLVILTGAIGEFIRSLPLTVAIALSSSFLVAMFLTPMLCYMFIDRGLHSKDEKTRKRFFLGFMQSTYNKAIDWCLKFPVVTITGSLLTILLAVLLFKTVIRHKFFPEAERDQFTVELWMPTGTTLAKTAESIGRIENLLKNDMRVKTYATFTGRSAPRFYYNYSPEMPMTNYAQVLVNTTGKKATASLYHELNNKVDALVPEGRPHVRLLQQGQPMTAPVEIRVSGDDIRKLKSIGSRVQEIIMSSRGSKMVRTDFREDQYGIRINLKPVASKLGFSTESISSLVYAGFKGFAASIMREGDNPVNIVLQLDDRYRGNIDDLRNMYLQSPVTGASVPLRQVADLESCWQPGMIVRRNGVRTLTVQSETRDGVLPSELLRDILHRTRELSLPPGYRISLGGEHANKQETIGYMTLALVISLVIIFIVLLFQFRNLKETGLVMITIPLSLFGAVAGLLITGNEFGFTAFTGIISLSGIVVRNAIILIDHTNELITNGMEIPAAALEAGKRRLRPIFLTAMAAAIGVLPMILSGSSLWSPLASVIAFGVVWSMLISTLSIPVLYIAVIKPGDKNNLLAEKQTV
jgi:multidrug efflux pump subunit AcrB